MGKVFAWIKRHGGVAAMYENSVKKSSLIYNAIENAKGFYHCPVDQPVRSRMNVPFRVGSATGSDTLEQEFLKQAKAEGMIQLKGHRSVGGIRASLYNAITVVEAQKLAVFMDNFFSSNKS